jgi:hypothetical protein
VSVVAYQEINASICLGRKRMAGTVARIVMNGIVLHFSSKILVGIK